MYRFDRKQQNSVKQLSFNKKKLKKRDITRNFSFGINCIESGLDHMLKPDCREPQIHSFTCYLLSTNYILGPFPGTVNTEVNEK